MNLLLRFLHFVEIQSYLNKIDKLLHQCTCSNGRQILAVLALMGLFSGLQCEAFLAPAGGHSEPTGQRRSNSQLAQASSSENRF